MLSWVVWVPALALAVIAFIGYRRLAAAGNFLSPKGAGLAAMQVALAFGLLAGTGSAEVIACTPGAKRCSSCDYVSSPPPFAEVTGEQCEEGDIWLPADFFYGDGGETEACEEAVEACNEWRNN